MKILSIDNMLKAAAEVDLENYDEHVTAIETAATNLARDLAKHLKIGSNEATWEGEEFGGTCVCFYPLKVDQPCPEVIDQGDEGGDWELPAFLCDKCGKPKEETCGWSEQCACAEVTAE